MRRRPKINGARLDRFLSLFIEGEELLSRAASLDVLSWELQQILEGGAAAIPSDVMMEINSLYDEAREMQDEGYALFPGDIRPSESPMKIGTLLRRKDMADPDLFALVLGKSRAPLALLFNEFLLYWFRPGRGHIVTCSWRKSEILSKLELIP